jgi:hypothetical protein
MDPVLKLRTFLSKPQRKGIPIGGRTGCDGVWKDGEEGVSESGMQFDSACPMSETRNDLVTRASGQVEPGRAE